MNETTQAASSPADVFNGEQVSLAEFSKYREDGTIPERFKPADPAESAPADESKETEQSDIDPDSDPDEAQEQPQKEETPADKRIKQLLAERYQLRRKLEEVTKQDARPDSSTARPAQPQPPQNYQEYRQAFKPSAFIEEYAKQNPDASYEDANAAMADHLYEVRRHFDTIEQRVNAEKQALESRVSEARDRYADFDEIKDNFLAKTISEKGAPLIPLPVLSMINDSDVMAHLLYTIGSDPAELAKFVDMAKSNPNKAIRYVTKVESLIAEELAKPAKMPVRGNDGKFAAPEKRQTQAPKPVSPVTGGSSRAFDVNDDSLSSEEWMRKRNKQLGIG